MDLFRKKSIEKSVENEARLMRCLSAFDLVFLGVGAVIGAGVFVLTGVVAATQAGPAIVFSYLLAGLACALSALSYAELAAAIGGCGSAYGYAYAGFGELIAWIVGWDLLLEYSITVSAVAVGWSSYFNDFLSTLGLGLPEFLLKGPMQGGILNFLAVIIIVLLASLLTLGMKSSSRLNNVMVLVKLAVIALFILIASGDIQPGNWVPFSPFGWNGVVQGASLIFFAYVGFDAVSTAAEEAINPQRDLPIGIIVSLIICTSVYVLVAVVLTGAMHYTQLNVASPISYALITLGHKTGAALIGVGAIAGLTTVMLVLLYGLTRIFFAMSRDGLMPRSFAVLHPKTQTPVRIIGLCSVVIMLTSALFPIHELAELVNIGTLFAFMVVCGGVLVLRYTQPDLVRPFKTPLMPYVPILGMLCCAYLICNLPWITVIRFVVWMSGGVAFYFLFSRHRSTLLLEQIKEVSPTEG